MSTILSTLATAAREAATYNPNTQAPPSCILWPDGGNQFASVLPLLRDALPELLSLGPLDLSSRQGPAEWIRCAMAGTLTVPGYVVPVGGVPIIYLPGISRADLRIASSLPETLQPLAYYSFRGCFFSQRNGRDWTAEAFLCTKDGELNLDVAMDDASLSALHGALPRILTVDSDTLRGRRLDKDEWNALLTGGDPQRELLQWLDGGDIWRKTRDESSWKAFCELVKSRYGLDPELDGRDEALTRFATREGQWRALFERYEESFQAYPSILPALKALKPPQFGLFDTSAMRGGWPQWNEEEEAKLRASLKGLNGKAPKLVAKTVFELETTHRDRRTLPWAHMGLSPLACALEPLTRLAQLSIKVPADGPLADVTTWYENEGWQVDAAAWESVAPAGGDSKAATAIKGVVATLYKPWLEAAALAFQACVEKEGYTPATTNFVMENDVLHIFADGLRLDTANRLMETLEGRGFAVNRFYRWAPIPTITKVGKPAAMPNGATVREFKDNLDHEGHAWGENQPKRIHPVLNELATEIEQAFGEGYNKVRVVTDHGWLLLPGGLPKENLPSFLADEKHGRWAVLKEGADAKGQQLPWSWSSDGETVYLARGICCHRAGMTFTHGGVSLQECRLLELEISDKRSAQSTALHDVTWSGLRLHCLVVGDIKGCHVDLRSDISNETSLLVRPAIPEPDGKTSALVADDDLWGQEAVLVVLSSDGSILSQRKLHIGG